MFVNIDPYKKYILLWLFSIFVLIIFIIGVGGLTRLTDSGLSITAWELFKGILPPLNVDQWNFYFNEYKKIPEFVSINYNMNLQEFKVIYYWEYAHRLIARLIGLVSIIPLIILYFKFKEKFLKDLKYLSIFALVCLQGLLGWFMVKSGLVDNTDVSHYRLASHLSVALIVLSLTFWFILNNLEIDNFSAKINHLFLNSFLCVIIIQIIFGAFLAGLDGGLLYNTWPDMNGNFIPDDIVKSDFYRHDSLNNPSVIHFYHRIVAYILIIFLIILNYLSYKKNIISKSIIILNIAIFLQVVLGIITLLTGVKIYYASLHQLGSVLVLTSFILIYYKNVN
jgi:cytochrome c oxidase assembly protein subunit 15